MSQPILPRLESLLTDLGIHWAFREIDHGVQLRCESGDVLSVYRTGRIILGGRTSRHSTTIQAFIDANPVPRKPKPARPDDPERVRVSDDGSYRVAPELEARLRVVAARVGVDSVQAWLNCAFDALAAIGEAAEPKPGVVAVKGDHRWATDAVEEILRLTGWPVIRLERESPDAPRVGWAAEWVEAP